MRLCGLTAALPLLLMCTTALAQPQNGAQSPRDSDATAPPTSSASPQSAPRAPAGLPVILEVVQPLSSKTLKQGDMFDLRLAAPIVTGGQVLAPSGAPGKGQVIDAAAAGPLGRPAKLVLAARYLEVNGVRTPLRGFHLGSAGADNSNTVMAASFVPYVGIFAGFMKGGEIIIPAGSLGQAKLGAEFPPATSTPGPAETGPPANSKASQ